MRRHPDDLVRQRFDVLIVGAGIVGACLAREAALRGLTVALVDRGDFGGGTSANSQKIIHGGLRYLQRLDFRRVRESARELHILRTLAPRLVQPLPVVLPAWGRGRRGRVALRAALGLYQRLTRDVRSVGGKDETPRMLSQSEVQGLFPGLHDSCGRGGALWFDAQVSNTERLTFAFVQAAAAHGAVVRNYVQVEALHRERNRVVGAGARDLIDDAPIEIRAEWVVNTAGPWADEVVRSAGVDGPSMPLVRAWNIVTPQLHSTHAVGVADAAEPGAASRMLFLTPWRHHTIIGTLYARAVDPPVEVAADECVPLLAAARRAFADAAPTMRDIVMVHHGVLPAAGFGRDAMPAEQAQVVDHGARDGVTGLLTVVGVKYTTARHLAERAANVLCARMGRTVAPDVGRFGLLDRETAAGGSAATPGDGQAPLATAQVKRLEQIYGPAAGTILASPDELVRLADDTDTLRAEVRHAVRDEMAVRVSDVVLRRTELGAAGRPSRRAIDAVAEILAEELAWPASRQGRAVHEFWDEAGWVYGVAQGETRPGGAVAEWGRADDDVASGRLTQEGARFR